MPTSFRARTIFPVDRPPIDNGALTIDGERIVAVGPASDATGTIHDLGEVALLPAFVNAHTHLEFSHLDKPLGQPGMRLIDWLPLAIAERQNRGHDAARSIALGIQESLLAGTAAVGEIATAEAVAYPGDHSLALTTFLEVIGFSRARAESAFAAAEDRLDAFLAAGHAVGLSPHAPYTVSPALLDKLMQLARQHDLPVAMHLAESEEELDLLASGTGPFRDLLEARSMWDPAAIPLDSTPLDYLQRLALAPRALVIHGNYLDSDEHEFLATHTDHMTLVYCPRTHAYFNHPPYPLAAAVKAGVNVALGTDSRASNPDLSLLAEMRHVALTHPEVAPEQILSMGTLAGAGALGREHECGSLTVGKLANFVAIPMPGDSLAELFAAHTPPSAIYLHGREV
jgi:cytosine/adenosine deaminase-related metal-dependent hydrolase